MYYLYIIRNLINNKVYIGRSINYKNRWKRHLYDLRKNQHHCLPLQRAWNKYGKNAFSLELLSSRDSEDEINKLEIAEIKKYKEAECCYNVSSGGEGGDHNRGRVSPFKGMTNRYSEETLQKIREARSRQTFSEETKKKISGISKKRWADPEFKKSVSEKISKARKGMKFSEEHCKNMGFSRKTLESNKHRGKLYLAFGEEKTLKGWSEDHRCIVTKKLLRERVYRGWEVEKAILTLKKGK